MSQDQEQDTGAWMVTFADLVMLLLTFFVLLLTMSSMDTKKLESLFTHFSEAAGVLEFSGLKEVSSLPSFIPKPTSSESLIIINQNLLQNLELPSIALNKNMKKMIKANSEIINVSDDERGIVLSFYENLFFEPGKAAIKIKTFPILDAIAKAISECPNNILIMGHTDSSPINDNLYKSNYELSSYRGLCVLEYFLKDKDLAPSRFAVGGYGPSRPLYPNDTPEHRASNRRVEIIFKPWQEA